MGNNAGGKHKPDGLGRGINGAEKAPAAESRAAICFLHTYLPHAREIDDQAAFTAAESGKAVTTATDSGKNPSGTRRPDNSLYILHTSATGDQTRRPGNHAVPDAPRFGKFSVAGAQQVSAELTVQ